MAKKFVRGVTGVDDIEKFDKSLTNVNDLVSDGQNTYLHTKKGKDEFYYNITSSVNNVQSSDDTLTITKENNTVSIANKNLATKQELAIKENTLSVDYGISKKTTGNTSTLGLEYTKADRLDLNELENGAIRGANLLNAPSSDFFFVDSYTEYNYCIQYAIKLTDYLNTSYRRTRQNGVWGPWREQVGDKSVIDNLLAQKQNTITNNTSIGVSGTELRQLYTNKQSYTHANGILNTHVKSVSQNTSVTTPEEEFNFIVKINKGAGDATFVLNDHDKIKFSNIMTSYGQNNSVRISGCTFKLSGSSLTVSTGNNVDQNYVITFSDII